MSSIEFSTEELVRLHRELDNSTTKDGRADPVPRDLPARKSQKLRLKDKLLRLAIAGDETAANYLRERPLHEQALARAHKNLRARMVSELSE